MTKKDQDNLAMLFLETRVNEYGFNSPEDEIDFDDPDWREKESSGFYSASSKYQDLTDFKVGSNFIGKNASGGQALYNIISVSNTPKTILVKIISNKGAKDPMNRSYAIFSNDFVERFEDAESAIEKWLNMQH